MLRGTAKKRKTYAILNARPTLQNQLTALKAQVSKQKPETQYYRATGTHTSASLSVETTHYNITASLINSVNFRDNVTGDRWTNLALSLKYFMGINTDVMRVLVYVPKREGTRFAPATNPFTEHPDPSSYWIISDFYVTHRDSTTSEAIMRRVKLKSLKTIYDSNSGQIEKGEVIVTIMSWTPGGTGATAYQYGHELVYNNL